MTPLGPQAGISIIVSSELVGRTVLNQHSSATLVRLRRHGIGNLGLMCHGSFYRIVGRDVVSLQCLAEYSVETDPRAAVGRHGCDFRRLRAGQAALRRDEIVNRRAPQLELLLLFLQ